jgi:predicted MFS family arabinose efflux permease
MVAATVTGQLVAQALLPLGGWRWVFGINAAIVALLAASLRGVMLPDLLGGARRSLASYFASMGRLVARPVLLLIYLGVVPVLGSFVAVYTALQLHGPTSLVGKPEALLELRASALPVMVAIPFLAGVLAKIRPTLRAALAMVLAAIAVFGLAFAGHSALLTIGALMFVFVGAIAVVSPGLTELVGTLSGPSRGAGVALYTSSLIGGASLGPQLVSALGGLGFSGVLMATCAIEFVSVALLLGADWLRPTA